MKFKILVCIKVVAEPESGFTINNEKKTVTANENSVFRMNRYDEFALEEALLIQEKFTESEITVISIGPAHVKDAFKRAIEMGAADAYFIEKDIQEFHSSRVTAGLIADFASNHNYDLILTGVMAEDTMLGQTGPMIASLLDYSCATSVIEQNIDPDKKSIRVKREIDALSHEMVTLKLPVLLTIQSGINRPRYPSLPNKLRAKKQEIQIITSHKPFDIMKQIGVIKIEKIVSSKETLYLQGTLQQKAEKLYDILYEKSLL